MALANATLAGRGAVLLHLGKSIIENTHLLPQSLWLDLARHENNSSTSGHFKMEEAVLFPSVCISDFPPSRYRPHCEVK